MQPSQVKTRSKTSLTSVTNLFPQVGFRLNKLPYDLYSIYYFSSEIANSHFLVISARGAKDILYMIFLILQSKLSVLPKVQVKTKIKKEQLTLMFKQNTKTK